MIDPSLAPARPWMLIGALLLTLRVARGLATPPLGYDSLLYHLFKPGQWVATGGLFDEAAPDWWSFLRAYPIGAELLWAWAMLPLHGDGLIAAAGALVWLGCFLAGYAAARALGAGRVTALTAAAAIVFLPAVIAYTTAAYADTTLLLAFLSSALFIARTHRERRAGDALMAAAALGFLASVKHTGLVLSAVGFGVVVAGVAGWARPARARARLLAAIGGVALAVAAPDYLRLIAQHGSPLYPLGGRNAELAALFSGAILPPALTTFDAAAFCRELWWGPRGLGWLTPLIVALAVPATLRALRRRTNVTTVVFLLATIWMPAALAEPGYRALRTFWIYSASRFLVPFVAAAIVLVAASGGRWATRVLAASFIVDLIFALPRGWGDADRAATGGVLIALLTVVAGLALAWWLGQRARPPRLALAVGAGLLAAMAVVGPWWDSRRAADRYRVYEEAAAGAVFDVHPARLPAWPLWKSVDDETPHVVAATAGWNGVGHNWARYPLLGTRLQNQVFYVPPTRDGRVIDTRDAEALDAAADEQSWLERLQELGVDRVVDLGAAPIEARWMAGNPSRFQPIAEGSGGVGRAYRFVTPPTP
jgi:hypothetical protein